MNNNICQGNFAFAGIKDFFENKTKAAKNTSKKILKIKAGKNQPITLVNEASINKATPQQAIAINPSLTPINNFIFLLANSSFKLTDTKTIPKAIKIIANT